MRLDTIPRNQKNAYFLLCLVAVLAVPVYLYGIRPIILALIGLITAAVSDFVFNRLFHFPRRKRDTDSLVCALALVCMLPASIDYIVVVIGVLIGLLVAKYPFGGSGSYLFHPAAVGLAAVGISFPDQVLKFPAPMTPLPLQSHIAPENITYALSPAAVLNVGGTPQISRYETLLGNYAGAMGATCVAVLGIVLLFLCIRRIIAYPVVISCLGTVFVYAALFPRIFTGRTNSVIYEMTSGVLLFGLIFLASDDQHCPKNWLGQLLYGFLLGLSVMIFRTVGALEIDFVFVLLFMNALSGELDKLGDYLNNRFFGTVLSKKKAGEPYVS